MTYRQADMASPSLHSCHFTQLFSFFSFFLSDTQLNPQSQKETQLVKVGIVMATPSLFLPAPLTDTLHLEQSRQKKEKGSDKASINRLKKAVAACECWMSFWRFPLIHHDGQTVHKCLYMYSCSLPLCFFLFLLLKMSPIMRTLTLVFVQNALLWQNP